MSEGTQRKLAAIVSADVVGYSRLMGIDEAGTHARLKARYDDLVAPRISRAPMSAPARLWTWTKRRPGRSGSVPWWRPRSFATTPVSRSPAAASNCTWATPICAPSWLYRTYVFGLTGRAEAAKAALGAVTRIAPDLRIGHLPGIFMAKDEAAYSRFADTLRAVGLPD